MNLKYALSVEHNSLITVQVFVMISIYNELKCDTSHAGFPSSYPSISNRAHARCYQRDPKDTLPDLAGQRLGAGDGVAVEVGVDLFEPLAYAIPISISTFTTSNPRRGNTYVSGVPRVRILERAGDPDGSRVGAAAAARDLDLRARDVELRGATRVRVVDRQALDAQEVLAVFDAGRDRVGVGAYGGRC